MERVSNIDEATRDNVEQWSEEIAEQILKCGEKLCEGQRVRRKQGWKAGFGMMRKEARLVV